MRNHKYWILWALFTLIQLISLFLYFNVFGLTFLMVLGWGVMLFSFMLGQMGVSAMRKEGQHPNKKTFIRSKRFVQTEIFSLVRQPGHLSWLIFSCSLILLSQHWLVALAGIAAMRMMVFQSLKDDRDSRRFFGEKYEEYARQVPRLNLVLGMKEARRRATEQKNNR